MVVLIATFLIVIPTIVAVLWPLLRASTAPATGQSWERDRLEALLSQRDSAYDAIRDLDFEYQLGNLSGEDYQELRERYRDRAAEVLRRLDRLDGAKAEGKTRGPAPGAAPQQALEERHEA